MEDKIYLNYDSETGNILGFYIKSIHGDNIPIPNIEIPPEKYQFYMNNNGRYKLDITTLADVEIEQSGPAPSMEEYLLDLDYRLSLMELGV